MPSTQVDQVEFGSVGAYQFKTPAGATLVISPLGATILSITPAGSNKSVLFLPRSAKKKVVQPMLGGIPVVFPNFTPSQNNKLPEAGFASTLTWRYLGYETETSKRMVKVAFEVSDRELKTQFNYLLQSWPHKFVLRLNVCMSFSGAQLKTDLLIKNANSANVSFDFQAMLQTHLAVTKIQDISIENLQYVEYMNPNDPKSKTHFKQKVFKVDKETNCLFLPPKETTGKTITVKKNGKLKLTIKTSMHRDVIDKEVDLIVTNPWKDGRSPGLANGDFERFIGVYPGSVRKYISCEPDETWTLSQDITFHLFKKGASKGGGSRAGASRRKTNKSDMKRSKSRGASRVRRKNKGSKSRS